MIVINQQIKLVCLCGMLLFGSFSIQAQKIQLTGQRLDVYVGKDSTHLTLEYQAFTELNEDGHIITKRTPSGKVITTITYKVADKYPLKSYVGFDFDTSNQEILRKDSTCFTLDNHGKSTKFFWAYTLKGEDSLHIVVNAKNSYYYKNGLLDSTISYNYNVPSITTYKRMMIKGMPMSKVVNSIMDGAGNIIQTRVYYEYKDTTDRNGSYTDYYGEDTNNILPQYKRVIHKNAAGDTTYMADYLGRKNTDTIQWIFLNKTYIYLADGKYKEYGVQDASGSYQKNVYEYFSTVVGVAPINEANDLFTYPNPASNHITIECGSKINGVTILNMLGEKMATTNGGKDVDVMLPNGSYLLNVLTKDGIMTRQITILND